MSTRKNLLLFMPDQLRADSLGAFGNSVAQTPAIDALADRGVRFSNAYSQHSVCAQSRISMFTGLYPHVSGHRSLEHLLSASERNVFGSLRDAGYHVALAGARGDMFAPGVTRSSCNRFGFTRAPDLDAVARWHTSPHEPGTKWYDAFYAGPLDGDLFDLDAATVQTACDWLGEGLPEPWCLFVALVYPHPPFAVERRWYERFDGVPVPDPTPPAPEGKPKFHAEIIRRYGLHRLRVEDWAEIRRTYYSMISRVDDQLHRVLRSLDRAGQSDRTVTFFFTDHGEYLGDHGLIEKWPSGLEDVLLANPLIIHDPDERSGVAHGLTELIDLTATLEDYAGIATAAHFGRSLRPLLRHPGSPHREAAFSEGGFLVSEEALLESGDDGQYRHKQEIQHQLPELVGRAMAVRTAEWSYVERLYEGPELYDRVSDPGETNNLAGRAGSAAMEGDLQRMLHRWLFETTDVLPTRRDPRLDADLLRALLGQEPKPAD